MPAFRIEEIPLLAGHDTRTGIVAVEPAGQFVRLFFRDGPRVHFRDEPFQPFLLASDPALVAGCGVPCSVRQLSGEGFYRFQLLFRSWADCLRARELMTSRRSAAADIMFISDLSHQYLLATGATLFKGMEFDELRTLTIDIETACSQGYRFSHPEREGDRIVSIACRDSRGWETVLRGDRLDEPRMLHELNAVIRQQDPDVIVGHNIFRFDLEYIRARAARHGVRLAWGRNGSEPHVAAGVRWNLAERVIEFPRWDIYGRHVIDTYFLVQHYDIAQRSLENHGLKHVARHFGIAADDRTYLDGGQIDACLREDPERLFRYNLDDVRETEALFRMLGYAWFLQTRIFPYSFQNCPLRGNATRINALFLREYLRQGQSIPARSEGGSPFEGGYTELVRPGVCGPVVHCDVASLYPSLMLIYRLHPAKDRLGLFLPMLAELRRFRLETKQAARECGQPAQRRYLDALQQVFKQLINSFFGYLGAPMHNFSDPQAAAEVTRLGRVTIRSMLEQLRQAGAEPVEVDTDGIYFIPPAGCEQEQEQRALVAQVSAGLPEGIEVEMDGRYRSMFAYKSKNYALLGYDDRVIIRGSSLKSRGMEPYLREFLREGVTLLLKSAGAEVERLYDDYQKRLRERRFDIAWVARTETLQESPDVYRSRLKAGKRNPSALFELALASERKYRAGDQISYYVCGVSRDVRAYENCRQASDFDPARPDENVAYYIEKLRLLKRRFEPFLPKQPSLFD